MTENREQAYLDTIRGLKVQRVRQNRKMKLLKVENLIHMTDKVRLQEEILMKDTMEYTRMTALRNEGVLLNW